MSQSPNEFCHNCRFVHSTIEKGELLLSCHRYPPQITHAYRPAVEAEEWCGEYQPVAPPKIESLPE